MIKSPCVGICEMNSSSDFCKGCGRSIDHITNWLKYTDDEKIEIMNSIKKNSKKKLKRNIIYNNRPILKKNL